MVFSSRFLTCFSSTFLPRVILPIRSILDSLSSPHGSTNVILSRLAPQNLKRQLQLCQVLRWCFRCTSQYFKTHLVNTFVVLKLFEKLCIATMVSTFNRNVIAYFKSVLLSEYKVHLIATIAS